MKRFAAAAIVTTLLAFAPVASANHYAGWHWARTQNPFTVTVLESVTPTWTQQIKNAAAEWSQSNKFDMVIVVGKSSLGTRNACAMVAGKVHVCNADYGAVGWAGLTELRVNGQHISAVRLRLNDRYVTSRGLRRLVGCHELGHSVGLGHRSESTSCMKQGQSNAHPDAHDYAELDAIYKHLDAHAASTAGTRTIKIYDWATPQ